MLRSNRGSSLGRSLSFESLESKQMLAGDVTVSVVAGTMVVKGDDAGNHVQITQGANGTSFIVKGLDGTTVKMNDTTAPETGLVVTGVKGIAVNMGSGEDTVDVAGVQIQRALTIETGGGADHVNITNTRAGAAITVLTGADNDTVQIGAVSTQTGLKAALSSSDANVRAGAALTVLLGDGDDSVSVDSASAIGAQTFLGGSGGDSFNLRNVRAASLVVEGGLGDGADTVNVSNAKAVAAVFAMGGGADSVNVGDSQFTSLNAAMGGGDDHLTLTNVKSKVTVLVGGEGSGDELTDGGGNSLGIKVVTGFEIPEGANTHNLPRIPGLPSGVASLLNRLFG